MVEVFSGSSPIALSTLSSAFSLCSSASFLPATFTTLKCLNVGCSLSSCSKAAASLTWETTHNVCRNILRYSVVENGKLFSASFVQRRFRNFSTSASCTKRPLAPTGIGIAFLSDFGLSALGFPVHVRKNSGKVNIPVWSSTLFIFLVMS